VAGDRAYRSPAAAMTAACEPNFRFADLVAGYVTAFDPARAVLDLVTSGGATVRAICRPDIDIQFLRNLGDGPRWASDDLSELLRPGRFLFARGIFTLYGRHSDFDATELLLLGREPDRYAFEDADWWVRQLAELARFYRRAQFGTAAVPDFTDYRTVLRLSGDKSDNHVQETDTISRLVYGMASAYLLTGDEDHLRVATAGTEYLREHLRFVDRENAIAYWYHGVDIRNGVETKLFSSVSTDDSQSIPAYEQIYALAGLVQTYRVTGDRRLLRDIDATLRLFEQHFRDPEHGGYFSHLDSVTLSPHQPSLAGNRSRKNWNSIGDHAPAYLFNLFLATGERRHAIMLEECFDLIVEHFPVPDSPFVQERFHGDWTPDRTWAWQQDRAVVGHNLKIAWNLMRMNALRPKRSYRELAATIGRTMPGVAGDPQRGGWYDVLERTRPAGAGQYRLTWHDRKTWWQQEQAILAYLVLAGNTGDDEFLRYARESAAFYNAFFLDHDEGGVYFTVLTSGIPYLLGNERLKGSHSMSMYHAAELCFLATVYERLLLRAEPLDMWFRPAPDGFVDRVLRVAPDVLPPGRVRLDRVEIDGEPYQDFDPAAMTVALPDATTDITVRVRLRPTAPADRGDW
jgi:mannose/cellobiose epimerase-like protein (N-acyl-D-glucosamine 2-epimerase family)